MNGAGLAQNKLIYKILEMLQSDQTKVFEEVVASSLFAVFGPVSPLVGFITYLAIEAGVNHALEKSGRATKSLLRRPFEKLATAFKNSLPEDSRLRKFLDRLGKLGEEFGNNPDELKKRVNEEMLKFLEELKQREEMKKSANEEIREAIRYLLSEELSEDVKRLEELFETSGYFAYEYYSILLGILTDRKCREILEKMGGIEKMEKETLDWMKEIAGGLTHIEDTLEVIVEKLDKIEKDLFEYNLSKDKFKLLSLYKIVNSKLPRIEKNKIWRSELEFSEICANYDVIRDITLKIKYDIWGGDNILILGKAGYGKSVLLKRIAIDMLQDEYLVIYGKATRDMNPNIVEIIKTFAIKKPKEKILVVIDDIQKCPKILYMISEEEFKYGNIQYLLAARKKELELEIENLAL